MDKRSHFQTDLEQFFKITNQWILCIRSQQIARADIVFAECIDGFEKLLNYDEMASFNSLLLDNFDCLLTAYANRDYILCADYMENGIIQVIKSVIAEWIPTWEAPFSDDEYRLEYTECAALTVAKKANEKSFYLHSNCNPWQEAFLWAESQSEVGIETYHIAGLGLGYHAILLAENPLLHVIVYEEDQKMIDFFQKKVATKMPENANQIEIVYDPEYRNFYEISCQLDERKEKISMYYPSIQTIQDAGLNRKMKQLFLQLDNVKYWKNNFAINFAYNNSHIDEGIKELQQELAGKKVYLIAGGPSLDKNITLLKERKKDSIIMTVGTSLRKCIREKIKPDYVIITDPKPYVHKQIEGLEECDVPLILLSTAYAHVARDYKGKKYILYQKGFEMAEQFSTMKGFPMVETGGSVTTTALDLCISCNVKKVVFLGLDLAFTEGKTHHEIAREDEIGEATIQIPDIYGNLVGTAENLNQYRMWIERRIEKAGKNGCAIKFVDATEGGARIQGTVIQTLRDEIEEDAKNE